MPSSNVSPSELLSFSNRKDKALVFSSDLPAVLELVEGVAFDS